MTRPTMEPPGHAAAPRQMPESPGTVRRRTTCRICDAGRLVPLFSFGRTPLANGLVRREDLDRTEPHYPLELHMCAACAHVQLLDVVDPAVLFRDYVYVSGTSATFVEHFRGYAEDASRRFDIGRDALIVDIGSNDGTFLRFFQSMGCRVLGIDPAVDIARTATASGIPTIPEFFTPEMARELVRQYGPAALVVANNVFAHVDDLVGFAAGVEQLLAPRGVFAFEVSYLVDVYEKTLFDTIYHEHLSYHTVGPLRKLFERAGLELFDADRVSSHGGSLRGYARRRGAAVSPGRAIDLLTRYEKEKGLYRAATFKDFFARIQSRKHELRAVLAPLRAAGRRIAGFGAPAKATTLMYVFDIGPDTVEYIVEDNPLKQGLFTPGFHIPIVPPARMDDDPPDYLLILAWNFADSIRGRYREFSEGGGRFIVPLPNVEVH